MKRIHYSGLFICIAFFASCQKEAQNADSNTSADVYIAGTEWDGVNSIPKYWKNGTAVNLPTTSKYVEPYSIYVSGNDVYVAGKAWADNPAYIGEGTAIYWKNGVAVNLSDGTEANSIIVSGNDVYVAGYGVFVSQSCGRCTPHYIAVAKYWKNGIPVILSDSLIPNAAYSIAVSGSDVYVAGFESVWARNTAKYWKNGQAVNLSSSFLGSEAFSIAVSGNDVYVAGDEDYKPTYWKNGVPVKLSDVTGEATSIAVSGSGDVYVAGVETTSTGFDVKYWKNGNPVILALNTTYNADAYSIAVSGNDIYVAGPGGYWKNGIWTTLSNKADANAIFIVKQ